MWAVIVRGLPLGVTPAALQRCIEETLNERPVFPQTPKISEDEALVYLPARDIQMRLASTNVNLRCGGTVVTVKRANKEQASQWITQRQPEKKQNPAPNSNIHKYLKQQKREQRKINKKTVQSQPVAPAYSLQPQRFNKARSNSPLNVILENEIDENKKKDEENLSHNPSDRDLYSVEDDEVSNTHSVDSSDRGVERDGSLHDELPVFSTDNQNSIIWYQYLIFMTRKKTPFYVTYPAEWCWDIEGQWLKFQEHYAINPAEAEKVDSRFSIGEPNKHSNSHSMVGDLLNMKVTDNNTGHQYEFKRTDKLIGTLIAYGQVKFERYYRGREKELFLFDRKTGYHESVSEDDLKVGDQIIFECWWNKDDNDTYHYDVTDRMDLSTLKDADGMEYTVHFEMFAFNVKKADPEEEEDLSGSNKVAYDFDYDLCNQEDIYDDLPLNPLLPNDVGENESMQTLSNSDPLVADDFRGQRFEGLLISLRRDDTGLIVCFPYEHKPRQELTLIFHVRFVKDSDRFRLSVNTNVDFSIGVNPSNFGQGLYGYVAMDITIAKHGFTNKFIPVTTETVSRKFRGKVVVAPEHVEKCGFIYNEFENNMCRLEVKREDEMHDFRVGMYVRYNERKIYPIKDKQRDVFDNNGKSLGGQRDEYTIIALDLFPIKMVERNVMRSYYTSDNHLRYKSKRYILGRTLKVDEDRKIEFKLIKLKRNDYKNYSDIYLILEQAETYVNAFLNTSGGALFFGIRDDGTVCGQQGMTSNKRDYLRNAIAQRVKHFKPSVTSEYYEVEFREVVDVEGYTIVDCYVIIIHVAKLYDGDSMEQHVKFSTSTNQIYERRITSVGQSSKCRMEITHLNPQQHRHHQHLGMDELQYALKPEFISFEELDNLSGGGGGFGVGVGGGDEEDGGFESAEVMEVLHNAEVEENSDTSYDGGVGGDGPKLMVFEDDGDLQVPPLHSSSPQMAMQCNPNLNRNLNLNPNLQHPPQNHGDMKEYHNMISIEDNHSHSHRFRDFNSPHLRGMNMGRPQPQQQQPPQMSMLQQHPPSQQSMRNNGAFGQYHHQSQRPQKPPPELIQYTTPSLNAKPIPPNTESGRLELAQRVQLKLNEMMTLTVYMMDPRWQSILTMAASNLYNAQKTTWMLMKNLEQDKIRQNLRERQPQQTPTQQQQPYPQFQAPYQQPPFQQPQRRRQQMSGNHHSNMDLSRGQRQNLNQSQSHNQSQSDKKESGNKALHQIRDISTHELINEFTVNPPRNTPNLNSKSMEVVNMMHSSINMMNSSNNSNDGDIEKPSIGQKYASSLAGAEPEIDVHGLPTLPDKSKYKAVAMEYCQKMGWKRPVEAAQCVGAGYRATVTFGKPGKEKSASGDGLRQKNAIYEAYIKLVPVVIPKNSAIELMIKWVPGYTKQEKVSTATIAQSGQSIMKHPKSVLLEWAQKNSIAPPKTIFSEFADSARNMRIWTAKVTFCGKTIESKGSKKKDAESKCFQELLKHVMSGGITKHIQ